MSPKKRERAPADFRTLGWREWVGLPDLGVARIKAKLDTGARTSSLHVTGAEIRRRAGVDWVHFVVHPRQRTSSGAVRSRARLLEYRRVRSSDGRTQRRPVVRTALRIGKASHTITLTLASRDEMGFRLLLGREALRGRFVVDPGESYLRKLARSRPARKEARA